MRTESMNPGSLEPVTVEEVKEYARVASHNLEDNLIQTLIGSARKQCEEYARICISPRPWFTAYRVPVYRDLGMGLGGGWHDPENVIKGMTLPRRPIRSLTSLGWCVDGETVPAVDYSFNKYTDRITWDAGYHTSPVGATALVATYEAGFEPDSETNPTICVAPDEIKTAVMIVATHLYENRAVEKQLFMPVQAQELLRGWWSSVSIA